MTKTLSVLLLGLALVGAAAAKEEAVKSTVKKDGTDVAPRVQTAPNATKADNPSAKGNVNPSAGRESIKDPYAVPLLREARPL